MGEYWTPPPPAGGGGGPGLPFTPGGKGQFRQLTREIRRHGHYRELSRTACIQILTILSAAFPSP
jgi:hypothetical protein